MYKRQPPGERPQPPPDQGQKGPPPGAVSGRLRQHGGGGDDFDVYPAGAGPLNSGPKIKTLCRNFIVFYRAFSFALCGGISLDLLLAFHLEERRPRGGG